MKEIPREETLEIKVDLNRHKSQLRCVKVDISDMDSGPEIHLEKRFWLSSDSMIELFSTLCSLRTLQSNIRTNLKRKIEICWILPKLLWIDSLDTKNTIFLQNVRSLRSFAQPNFLTKTAITCAPCKVNNWLKKLCAASCFANLDTGVVCVVVTPFRC